MATLEMCLVEIEKAQQAFADMCRKLEQAGSLEERITELEAKVAEMEPKADAGWAYAEAFRKVFAEDAFSYGFLGDATASDAPEQQP